LFDIVNLHKFKSRPTNVVRCGIERCSKMSSDKNSGGVESVLALVLYFARNKYWHHVQTVADQVIKKRGRAPVLSFWKAYSVGREGEYSNSIRQFDDLRSKREVRLPICVGGV
jgi:hypothetical protein